MISKEEAKEHVGKGWHDLLDQIYELIDPTEVIQVKEKFGSLRIHIISTPPNLDEIYRIALKSEHTCEFCGATAEIRRIPTGTWYKCICDVCYGDWENVRR